MTKRYTEEAVAYINRLSGERKPFFLYLAYTMPHVPLFASEDFAGKGRAGRYGDAVEELDWSVGEIRNALESAGLADNTLVIFTSDNGPVVGFPHGGSAGLLKGLKGTTFEGGMCVPGIFWWPGKINPAIVTDIGSVMDLYATALSLVGVYNEKNNSDSIDLTPVFKGQIGPRESLPYYSVSGELLGFRNGQYKIHFSADGINYGEDKQTFLYHLGEDPGEKFDLSRESPNVLADMIQTVDAHKSMLEKAEPIFDLDVTTAVK